MNKRQVKKIFSCIIFLFITLYIVVHLTYIMRGSIDASSLITGIYELEEDSVDVVIVGASGVYDYYKPLLGYEETGITAYDLAGGGMACDTYEALIREILKSQSPSVIVVDLRTFLSTFRKDEFDKDVRVGLDTIDMGINHFRGIHDFLSINNIQPAAEYYLPIIQYHNNIDGLKEPENWNFVDNRKENSNQVGVSHTIVHPFEKPQFETNDKGGFSEESLKSIDKICNLCSKKDIDLLFICTPLAEYKMDEKAQCNYFDEYVKAKGYSFIDFNDCVEEMGLDYDKDFADLNHVNTIGAIKFTNFFSHFLVDNYGLIDHRNDEKYNIWNIQAQEYDEQLMVAANEVESNIKKIRELSDLGIYMRNVTDTYEWLELSKESGFTVIYVSDNSKFEHCSDYSRRVLSDYGISVIDSYYWGIRSDTEIKDFSTEGAWFWNQIGNSGSWNKKICYINIENTDNILVGIGPEDGFKSYHQNIGNDIQIYLFDNNYYKVVDAVSIKVDVDGTLRLNHISIEGEDIIVE